MQIYMFKLIILLLSLEYLFINAYINTNCNIFESDRQKCIFLLSRISELSDQESKDKLCYLIEGDNIITDFNTIKGLYFDHGKYASMEIKAIIEAYLIVFPTDSIRSLVNKLTEQNFNKLRSTFTRLNLLEISPDPQFMSIFNFISGKRSTSTDKKNLKCRS